MTPLALSFADDATAGMDQPVDEERCCLRLPLEGTVWLVERAGNWARGYFWPRPSCWRPVDHGRLSLSPIASDEIAESRRYCRWWRLGPA